MTKQKETRSIISFENSNSWLKRYSATGLVVIQAGYQENPGKLARKDPFNPVVALPGQVPRWYGQHACASRHVPIHGRSKVQTARDSFSACLQPADDGMNLEIIASHWNVDEFPDLVDTLLGRYSVIRNGQKIECDVIDVRPVLEGIGSYWAVEGNLERGNTLLLELGFGTAEMLQIDCNGEVYDGRVMDELGVSSMVKAIAADQTVRGLLQDTVSGVINPLLISKALKESSLGRISEDTWGSLKVKYGQEYFRSIQSFLKTQAASEFQGISNLVLTGGGAAFLKGIAPKISQNFLIPDQPEIASVRGAFMRGAINA